MSGRLIMAVSACYFWASLSDVPARACDRATAQSAENVAVVINDNSPESQQSRTTQGARVAADQRLHIRTLAQETVDRRSSTEPSGPIGTAIARGIAGPHPLHRASQKAFLRVAGTPANGVPWRASTRS